MAWSAASQRANEAIIATFGIWVTLVGGGARRRIKSAPGDVVETAEPFGNGIALRKTCRWLVLTTEARKALGRDPRRGDVLEVQLEGSTQRWVMESADPDLTGGHTCVCILADTAAVGAKNAEEVR